ncbi:PadR family transcriptional regulator [Candidatus Saccharibacteria bacterium]|nr:MAG: PadR family transcriptional regulator [Candidatus Saccharibacteria bacterium]
MSDLKIVDDSFASLRKGLLEFAVLSVISRHEAYAADILESLSDTAFATSEGTLYPLLSRLKREQWVAYKWAESETGPPRKYYQLTAAGRTRLNELHAYWQDLYISLEQLGGKR